MNEINKQFTVENIECTLHHFYHDAESQAQANQFLMLAQVSPEAWNFAWDLIHPSKPSEVQFFGASTLHMKISKQWDEVPPEHYGALRERLLSALFSYTGGPRIILTRLCIAISSFIIHTVLEFWPTAISDIISALQPQNIPHANPQQIAHVLLEFLTILIEEFLSTHLPPARIGVVRKALRSSLKTVMDIVQSVLSQTSAPIDLCEMSLKCYASWAQLGPAIFDYKQLLVLAFDCVYREEISQTALESLQNIAIHPESYKYPTVILAMVEHVSKFDGLLKQASQEYDMDKCCGIYALIISIADNHCQLLIDTILDKPEKKEPVLKLIGFILQCSSTPGFYPVDEVCSEQAFVFWYSLQDTIVSSSRCFESLLLIFFPIFQSLLDTYLIKLRYPPEHLYNDWQSDEKESFRCYRQDVGDSIMYCYVILKQSALANLLSHLNVAISTCNNNPTQWQYLEACLFAFKEVSESVDVGESQYISQFMALLQNVPLKQIEIISATMEAIGAFADWINSHPENLGNVIPLLLTGLQNSQVAVAATFALKDISRDCFTSMGPFVQQIMQGCLEAVTGNVLKSREKVRIMCTVGKVLSIMPYHYILEYLDVLLSPVFSRLQSNIGVTTVHGTAVTVQSLHMLSMLFGTLDPHYAKSLEDEEETAELKEVRKNNLALPHPSLCVLQKLLDIVSSKGNDWKVVEQTAEAYCDALKRAISMLSTSCKPYLHSILNLLLYLYRQCPYPSMLDLSKQLLILFKTDTTETGALSNYFEEICCHTVQFATKDFRESTDMIESFLQVLSHVISRAIIFLKSEKVDLLMLFQFGMAALNLPERPTVKAAAGFLSEFIMYSREVPSMLNAVNSQGEILILQVLKAIGGESPRPVVEYMTDILMALSKKYFDNLCRWLGPFTTQEGFPSNRVTQKQKEEFVRIVLRERTNKRRLQETVTEFSLVCRGLIGTEYAAQSCQSLN